MTSRERLHFIGQLDRYAKNKSHRVVLFFDGEWDDGLSRSVVGMVTIIFSGRQFSADDRIKSYIQKHKNENLLLVSSDRELNDYAAQYSIASIDSTAFRYLLLRSQKALYHNTESNAACVKLSQDSPPDVDALMKQLGNAIVAKEEDVNVLVQQRTKKSTDNKNDRTLLKKLNKL